jgi:hypothetical protein
MLEARFQQKGISRGCWRVLMQEKLKMNVTLILAIDGSLEMLIMPISG